MEGASSFGERVIISSARLCFEMEDKTYLVVNGRRGLALMFVNFWGMEPNTIEAPDPTGNSGASVLNHAEQPLQAKIKRKVN